MSRSFFIVLSVAAATCAIGFVAGRWSNPPATHPANARAAVAGPVPATVHPSAPPRPQAPSASPAPAPVAVPTAALVEAPPAKPVAAPPAWSLARIRSVAAERDPLARMQGFAEILGGMTAQNARQIAEAFRSTTGDGRNRDEFALVMDAWGRLDGVSAVAYGEQLGDQQAMGSALTGWAMQYPEAAKQWALSHHAEQDNPWMIPVIAGAARTQLAAAQAMLYSLPYGAARGRSLDFLIDAYADKGMSALVGWAEGIPDQRLREGTVARVAPRLAREDPRRAAEWAMKNAGQERLAQALLPVVTEWAQKEPSAAVAWSEQLEPGRTRDMALEHVVSTWAWKDPASAEDWLSRTPPGPSFDRARTSIGMRYFQSDPVRAMTWVSTVSDENMRNRMLERIAGAWTERDPEAAAKFLNK